MPNKLDFSMFLDDYLSDAKEGFGEVNKALIALEKAPSDTTLLAPIIRAVHTLKSSSMMLEFADIAELAHTAEDVLDKMRREGKAVTQEVIDLLFETVDALESMVKERASGKKATADYRQLAERLKKLAQVKAPRAIKEEPAKQAVLPTIEKIKTVRVRTEILDELFNLVGELIITKNRLDNLLGGSENKDIKAALTSMRHIITALQENISNVRLIPIDEIFQKFPRMVRDLAKEDGKEIDFLVEGREIELDKGIVDAIGEPLIHLLRNAINHGIEHPEEREKLNKSRQRTVRLSASRTENHILIEAEDDGRGIDPGHLREAFLRKGLIKAEEAETLTDDELLNLLFRQGFSTAEKVTGVSGRGVGLNIVKTVTEKLGGWVDMTTAKGKGTKFTLRLPVTTALMQTLVVGVGTHVFAVPSDNVLETLDIKQDDIKMVRDSETLLLRKQVLPFFRLNRVLNIPAEDSKSMVALILYRGDSFMAMGVDTVITQTENIVKPFDPLARKFKGFSGGTIMGDGRVALLLDIPGLFGFEMIARKEEL